MTPTVSRTICRAFRLWATETGRPIPVHHADVVFFNHILFMSREGQGCTVNHVVALLRERKLVAHPDAP